MKTYIFLLAAIVSPLFFSNCANGKKISKGFDAAYYTVVDEGATEGGGIKLYLPHRTKLQVKPDTIFFRGRKAALKPSSSHQNVLVAFFPNQRKDRDVIMHVDPKEEYGNPLPPLPEQIPFELQKNEAVVQFPYKDGSRFLKVTVSEMNGIKRPENIRH